MSDVRVMIEDTAERLLREQCSKELVDAAERGEWPADLWRALMEVGLPLAAAPERLGGVGLPLEETLGLLRLVGRHVVPVPLAETLIGGALLEGLAALDTLPEGPLAMVVAAPEEALQASRDGADWVLDGRVAAVPFAPVAETLLVAWEVEGLLHVGLLSAGAVRLQPGRSIAGEPQATVILDAAVIAADRVGRPTAPGSLAELRGILALSRALMMAGAMQSLLDLSVDYALERSQFGRPIAKFQAVQQQLAVLAGEAAAAIRAADGALEAFATDQSLREAGVAKARAGEAAGRGAEIAHQVHGAMGFTYEHALHHRSRRLWAWRDEYGTEACWQERLGRELCANGADALWATLTRPPQ